MNRKWSPNWLILFTVCLFLTALTMFYISYREQFGLKKCIYGGEEYFTGQHIDGQPHCYCNEKGQVTCEEYEIELDFSEISYENTNLEFSSKFLNFIDPLTIIESVKFSNVGTVDDQIRIVIERLSFCNQFGDLPPQIGFYSFENGELFLTTSTNLIAGDYNEPCIISNTYFIEKLDEIDGLFYQAEDGRMVSADICIFRNKVFNSGDAYVGDDGEVIICQ